jgi:hypothetical protein
MGKPTNIASTSHAQAAEFAALASVASDPADVARLKIALHDAMERVVQQDTIIATMSDGLAAEKEAHAATQAALEAATATKTE